VRCTCEARTWSVAKIVFVCPKKIRSARIRCFLRLPYGRVRAGMARELHSRGCQRHHQDRMSSSSSPPSFLLLTKSRDKTSRSFTTPMGSNRAKTTETDAPIQADASNATPPLFRILALEKIGGTNRKISGQLALSIPSSTERPRAVVLPAPLPPKTRTNTLVGATKAGTLAWRGCCQPGLFLVKL
jgi:hypothetical protein